MNALKHTTTPTFLEMKNKISLPTTQSKFGITYVNEEMKGEILIENLDAETEYVIFLFL